MDLRRKRMSAELRWEHCGESAGGTRPALHGGLRAACFHAATPARLWAA